MKYEMECDECEYRTEVDCPISKHEIVIKPGFACECGGHVRQVITSVRHHASREAFPKGWNENIAPDPVYVRDKHHARDICAQHGNVSKWVENDC